MAYFEKVNRMIYGGVAYAIAIILMVIYNNVTYLCKYVFNYVIM